MKKGICKNHGIIELENDIRDIPFSDSDYLVKNVKVFICSICKEVVAIPSTETQKIKENYENYKNQ